MFNEKEKNEVIAEFNNRNGMYSRLYDRLNRYGDGFGEPIGIMYRCESNVDKDRVVVLRYSWSDNKMLSKKEFEQNKIKGMAIALKKADRYLKACQKKNIEVEDYCELNLNSKYHESIDKLTKEYIEVFMNRINKYYKKPMKVIVLWS